MLDGRRVFVLLDNQHALSAHEQAVGDEIAEPPEPAEDHVSLARIFFPAKRQLHAPLDDAVHGQGEDRPDEDRGAEDQRDTDDLAHRPGIEEGDVPIANRGHGHHNEIERIEPREMFGMVEVRDRRGDHRRESCDQPLDQRIRLHRRGLGNHRRGHIPERMREWNTQGVEEGRRRNLCGIEDADVRMRGLKVRSNVLVEQRRDDRNRPMERDERGEQLQVAMVPVVHQEHHRQRLQIHLLQRPRDHIKRGAGCVVEPDGLQGKLRNGVAVRAGELARAIGQVPGPDDEDGIQAFT